MIKHNGLGFWSGLSIIMVGLSGIYVGLLNHATNTTGGRGGSASASGTGSVAIGGAGAAGGAASATGTDSVAIDGADANEDLHYWDMIHADERRQHDAQVMLCAHIPEGTTAACDAVANGWTVLRGNLRRCDVPKNGCGQ